MRPRLHRLAAAAAGLCLPVWLQAASLPTGLQVVQGQASVVTQGSQMTVRNTAGAILNWQSFSIGAGSGVYFEQANAASKVLNRVTGADPSLILGSLASNGQVWLLNPNGVLFGQGARVDVAGLVASTLRLNDNDFLSGLSNGSYRFSTEGSGAAIVNQGSLKTSLGGQVVLLGQDVRNEGSIEASHINLAAARSVTLVDTGAPNLAVQVDVPAGEVLNLGRLVASGGVIDVYGAIVNQQGLVQADTVGTDAQGRVVLRAAQTLTLADGSVTQARGSAAGQQGGHITLDASGLTHVAGTLDVTSAQAQGGGLQVQGTRILLNSRALLDASGASGGGTVRVGGDFQGRGTEVRHADMLSVAAGARLRANATERGDGGLVVLWSDTATRFAGSADARGGAQGGNGGLVEVSSKGYLDFRGTSDRSAPYGREGLLLLDPTNLTIQATGPDIDDSGGGNDLTSLTLAFADPGANSIITSGAVETQLVSGNVTLQATNNILVNSAISSSSGRILTLQAGNDLLVNAPISVLGALNLSANDADGLPSGFGKVTLNAPLATQSDLFITNGGGTGVHAFGSDITARKLDINGSVQLTANNVWTLSGTSSNESFVVNNIGGTGSLTKAGTGDLALSAPNTYSGGSTVSDGILTLGTATAAGSGLIHVDGGTLRLGPFTYNNDLALNSGSLTNSIFSSTTLTGTVAVASAINISVGVLSMTGVVSGFGGFVVTDGELALTGVNTYAGGTQLLGANAILRLTGAPATAGTGTILLSGGTLYVDNGAVVANQVNAFGGTLANSAGVGTISGPVQVSSGFAATSTGAGLSLTGNISSDGTVEVLAGNISFSGNNSYSGGTRITGNLNVSGGSAIPDGSQVEFLAGGATLALLSDETIGSLQSVSGNGTVLLAGRTLTVGGDGVDSSFTGTITGTGGLAKVGLGRLTLSGANLYSGGTTVLDGVLAVSGNDNLGSGAVFLEAGTTLELGSGSSLSNQITVNSATIALPTGTALLSGNLVLNDDTLFDVSGSGLSVSGDISGAGAMFKTGSGTLTLVGNNTGTGDTQVQAGTLVVGGGNALSDTALVTLDSGSTLSLLDIEGVGLLAGNGDLQLGTSTLILRGNGGGSSTFSGGISGSGGITLDAAGNTFTVASFNSYTGATRVLAGTMVLSGGDRLPGSTTLEVANGGTLVMDGFQSVVSATVGGAISGTGPLASAAYTLTDGAQVGVGLQGSGTLTSSGSVTVAGTVDVPSVTVTSGIFTVGAANLLVSSGNLTINELASVTLAGNNSIGALTLGGTVFGPGALAADTVAANGAAARIQTDVSAATAATVQSGVLTVGDGATSGTLITPVLTVSSGAVLAYDRSDTFTLSDTINGAGTLRKVGTGTLNFTGTAIGLSTLEVNAGVFNLAPGGADRIGDSTVVNVVAGATLNTGTNAETVGSLNLSGTLGGSGTLTAASYTLQAGSQVNTGLGGGSLQVSGIGTSTLNAAAQASPITVNNGATLAVGALGSLSNVADVTVLSGGTLSLAGNSTVNTFTLTGTLAGAGTLTTTSYSLNDGATIDGSLGAGTLNTNGTVTLNGTSAATSVSVNGGPLNVSGANRFTGTPNVTVNTGATLALNGSQVIGLLSGTGNVGLIGSTILTTGTAGSSSFNGVIGGPGSLNKVGTGTFTLASAGSSYGGATTVAAGTLATGTADVLPDISAVTVASGATLSLGGSDTVFSLHLLGALVGSGTLTAATYLLDGGTASANLGIGALSSVGTSTLNGTSAAGTVNVSNGSLQLGSADRLADNADVTIQSNGTLILNGNDTVGSLNLFGAITGTGSLLVNTTTLNGGTYNVDISSAFLVSEGDNLLNGTASSTTVTVNNGTLTLGAGGRFTGSPAVTINGTGILALGGDETIGSLAGSGQLQLGAATLTTGADNQSTTFSGVISGSGGLTKLGEGLLTLSGINTYTGTTTVFNDIGRLILEGAGPGTMGPLVLSGGRVVINTTNPVTLSSLGMQGGWLAGSADVTVAGAFSVSTSSAEVTGTGTFTTQGTTLVDLVNESGGFLGVSRPWTNAGTLTLGGDDYFNFGYSTSLGGSLTNASGGVLNITSTHPTPMAVFGGTSTFNNAGTLNVSTNVVRTIALDAFANSGSVNVGAGVLNISASGSDSGTYTVASGATLGFTGGTRTLAAAANPTGGGSLAVSGGTVDLSGSGLSLLPLNQSGGSFNVNSSSSVTVAGLTLTGGVLALNAGSTISLPASNTLGTGTLSLSTPSLITVANLSLDGTTLTGTHDLTVTGNFDASGNNSPLLRGSGTFRTEGTTTITVSTGNGSVGIGDSRNWVNAGTINLPSNDSINLGATTGSNTTLTNAAGGVINFASSYFSPIVSSFGTTTVNNAGTINQNATGSPIFQAGSFNNTGALNVNAGTLQMNATFTQAGTLNTGAGATFQSAGDFTNTAAGTLSGSGTLRIGASGTGTLTNQGVIGPGNSPGTLNVSGNLVLTSSSTLNMEVAGTASGLYDSLAVSGSVVMAGALNATVINGYQPANGDSVPLITMGGTASGSFLPTLPSGFALGYNLATGEGARLIYSSAPGSLVFTNAAGDLNWATPANWGGALPGAADTAVISAGFAVAHATGNDTIGGLTLSSGNALNVSGGTLTVNGPALLDGTFTVSGSGQSRLAGTVTSSGTVNVLGGTLLLEAPATLVALNLNGGTLGGNNGSLDLTGTFTRTGGAVIGSNFSSIALRQTSGSLAPGALTAGTVLLTTQDAAGTLLIDSAVVSGGTMTLTAAGALQLAGTGASLAAAGDLQLSAGSASLAAPITANRMVVQGATGVQLSGSAQLSATATTGDALVVNAGSGPFVNSAGASALSVAGGARWLVYSANPAADTVGGLAAAFKQYNASYPGTTPAAAGNGLLYSLAPVLSGSLQGTVNKVYDGNTAATLGAGNYSLSGALAADTVAYTSTPTAGTYTTAGTGNAPKDVGSGKTVQVTGLTVTATEQGSGIPVFGYQFDGNASGAVGAITPATLAVAGLSALGKVYDAGTAATLAGNATVTALGGDVVTLAGTASGSFADKNVGTAKPVTVSGLTLAGADAANYSLQLPTGLVADITPAPLLLSGLSAASRIYNTTTGAALSGNASISPLGSDIVGLAGTAVGSFADKNVGNAKPVLVSGLTLTGTDAANYSLQSPPGLVANITPATLAVSGLSAGNKVYDGGTAAVVSGTAQATPLAGDTVVVSGVAAGNFADRNVGTAKPVTVSGLVLAGADAANYALQIGTLSADITAATLSYVAAQLTATAGVTLPALGGSVTGLLGGDTVASATTGTLSWTTTADASSAPGSYAISGSGLAALNYQFAQAAGNATALTLVPSTAPPTTPSTAAQTTTVTTTVLAVAVQSVAVVQVVSTPTTDRVLDAVPSLSNAAGSAVTATAAAAGSGADAAAVTFRPINLSQTPREDLQTLLAARASFKKKVFQDSLSRLETDPALADARPCRDEAELAGGQCVLTETLKQLILQARAAQAAAVANAVPGAVVANARAVVRPRKIRQAVLPVIERKLALLVGTNRYADQRIPQLLNAVSDVRAVRSVLETRLGYETTVVEDGDKQAIIAALNKLALEAGPNDSVMIYYAGHGVALPETGTGYWIPADAKADVAETWLSNGDISRLVALVGAKQMMLVSDSCYSGSLVGSTGVQVDRAAAADDLLSRKAVVVMSSGGDEPVSDEGREGHSVFAWHLMQALGDVDKWQMGGSIFERLRGAVAREFPQTPRYGVVRAGGHQGNTDYLFERRELEAGGTP